MNSGRIRRWLVGAGLVLVGASGCTISETATTRTPTDDRQGSRWGPLAVVDDPATAGGGAALGPGTLQIGPECVTLHVDAVNRDITLVWRSAEVAWDSNTNEIVFTSPPDGPVRLADGARITVGGGAELPLMPAWLAKPAATCPATRFSVHAVVP